MTLAVGTLGLGAFQYARSLADGDGSRILRKPLRVAAGPADVRGEDARAASARDEDAALLRDVGGEGLEVASRPLLDWGCFENFVVFAQGARALANVFHGKAFTTTTNGRPSEATHLFGVPDKPANSCACGHRDEQTRSVDDKREPGPVAIPAQRRASRRVLQREEEQDVEQSWNRRANRGAHPRTAPLGLRVEFHRASCTTTKGRSVTVARKDTATTGTVAAGVACARTRNVVCASPPRVVSPRLRPSGLTRCRLESQGNDRSL